MNLPLPVTLYVAVILSCICATSAVAGDYPTCKDDTSILRDCERMITLADEGYESAQSKIMSFDSQINEICLCKQVEWDRLKSEYIETVIAYADGRRSQVRLAKPIVIRQPRPECVAPSKRSWPEPVTEEATVKIPVEN